jgi:hypothetical protein
VRERGRSSGSGSPPAAPKAPSSALDSLDPPRNFTIATEDRVRALAVGVPAYAARKKRIEDAEEAFTRELVARHEAHAHRLPTRGEREAALLTEARTFDLAPVNRLIEAHNKYYPIEADLPIDPITGIFLLREEPWLPEPPLTAERLVAAALALLGPHDAPARP